MSGGEKSVQARATVRSRDRGRPSTPFLRERVLRSAVRLFSTTAFDQVTIDAVAADAGVGKGSVYRQFRSKEELYVAAVVDGFVELQGKIRAALRDDESVEEQVATIVNHTVKFFWGRRQFFEFLRDPRAVPRKLERLYRSERAKLAMMLVEVLRAAAAAGDLRDGVDERLAAEAVLGMIRGINRYARQYTSPAGAARTVIAIFLAGCLSPSRKAGVKTRAASLVEND
jgi:AcrR family transcriptional regulator